MNNDSSVSLIIDISYLCKELKTMFIAVKPLMDYTDVKDIVQHYVDCYVYGSVYTNHSVDPMLTTCSNFGIPTDIRVYISKTLAELITCSIGQQIVSLDRYGYNIVAVDWNSEYHGRVVAFRKKVEPIFTLPNYVDTEYRPCALEYY